MYITPVAIFVKTKLHIDIEYPNKYLKSIRGYTYQFKLTNT